MIDVLPRPALHSRQLLHAEDLPRREISRHRGRKLPGNRDPTGQQRSPSMNLCVNFDPRVCRNHVIWNGHALQDGDSLLDNGIVLHTAVHSLVDSFPPPGLG